MAFVIQTTADTTTILTGTGRLAGLNALAPATLVDNGFESLGEVVAELDKEQVKKDVDLNLRIEYQYEAAALQDRGTELQERISKPILSDLSLQGIWGKISVLSDAREFENQMSQIEIKNQEVVCCRCKCPTSN